MDVLNVLSVANLLWEGFGSSCFKEGREEHTHTHGKLTQSARAETTASSHHVSQLKSQQHTVQ